MKYEQTCPHRYDRSNVDRDLEPLRTLFELMDEGVLVHATNNRERHYIKGRNNDGMRVHIVWYRHQRIFEATINALSTKCPQSTIEFTIADLLEFNFLNNRLTPAEY